MTATQTCSARRTNRGADDHTGEAHPGETVSVGLGGAKVLSGNSEECICSSPLNLLENENSSSEPRGSSVQNFKRTVLSASSKFLIKSFFEHVPCDMFSEKLRAF